LDDARKAVAFSALGVTTTWIMALVGLAIVAYYQLHPLPAEAAASLAAEPDRIFPYYVVHALPDGISGLIIAALFAAGISTLDSALTALSQTSVMGLGRQLIPRWRELPESRLVQFSKRMIVGWGLVLGLLAYVFSFFQESGLLALGFIVPGYTYGSLVGIALLAYWRRGRFPAIATGAGFSILSIALLHREGISFFWWFPVGAIVVIGITLLWERVLPAPQHS
jgi:Na+/proline symporter